MYLRFVITMFYFCEDKQEEERQKKILEEEFPNGIPPEETDSPDDGCYDDF